jgi:hypothetical protein
MTHKSGQQEQQPGTCCPQPKGNMNMKTVTLLNRAVLATACAALTLSTAPMKATDTPDVRIGAIRANAGITFVFTPTSDPLVFTATVSGVIQTSLLGSCIDNAVLEVRFPSTPGQPVTVNGTATWTSIDGANSLRLTVAGTAAPDPANAGIFNNHYQITFTGGTGAYVTATGTAQIDEVVMFTGPLTGTAAWTLKGTVVTAP